jgi:hypothetical protein
MVTGPEVGGWLVVACSDKIHKKHEVHQWTITIQVVQNECLHGCGTRRDETYSTLHAFSS